MKQKSEDKYDSICPIHNENFDSFCKVWHKNTCRKCNEIAHLEHDRCDYDEIITSITKQAGKKFNPAIVEAAVTVLEQRIREKEEEAIFGKVE